MVARPAARIRRCRAAPAATLRRRGDLSAAAVPPYRRGNAGGSPFGTRELATCNTAAPPASVCDRGLACRRRGLTSVRADLSGPYRAPDRAVPGRRLERRDGA